MASRLKKLTSIIVMHAIHAIRAIRAIHAINATNAIHAMQVMRSSNAYAVPTFERLLLVTHDSQLQPASP